MCVKIRGAIEVNGLIIHICISTYCFNKLHCILFSLQQVDNIEFMNSETINWVKPHRMLGIRTALGKHLLISTLSFGEFQDKPIHIIVLTSSKEKCVL